MAEAQKSDPKPKAVRGLGRGLAALIGDAGPEPETIARSRAQRRVPIEFLRPSPRNPRTLFDEENLVELADSIRTRGIIQPILVRTVAGVADAYEIIAGERRWRAAQRAELHEVPIVLVEADDRQALEIAIIENVQRTDLNILDEATGYARLLDEFGYSQGELAKVIGKSRPHVANTLRLLKLPAEVRDMVAGNALSAGHARALLGAADPLALAKKAAAEGLSVRNVEDAVAREQGRRGQADDAPVPRGPAPTKSADTRALETRIAHKLGLRVDIKHKGEKGEVRLAYENLEQLDYLIAVLGA